MASYRIALAFLLTLAHPAAAQEEPEPAARPDVVLITLDTLRADALGFAGNAKVATPVLDRLAKAGRVFTDAHAHNVVTLPSHTNILTGLYPYQHGVRDNTGFRLGQQVPTLASVLQQAGYATAAFVAAYPLDSQFGLDRGFDVYDDHYPEGSDPTEFVLPERPGNEVVALALAWWHAQAGGPRFLWLHLFDPHAPYAPPEPFATRFAEAPYLGEVAATDAHLAPLLEPFLGGAEPPAVIALTSDHGEALGEHGELTHGLFAYEATLKVPLVLWGEGVRPGRDGRAARHVDIFPTLLAAAGVEAPAAAHQRHGSSLLTPAEPPSSSYFESLSANLNRGWAPLRGLIRAGHKLIALPLPELYDLPRDPAEASNLVRDRRGLAGELRDALPAQSQWPPARGQVSPEEEERLRSLGYLSGSAAGKERYGPEDDPKSLIALDRKMHRTIDLYSRRELEQAVALAKEIVAERPAMRLGQSLLAQALLESGKTGKALAAMENARRDGAASDTLLRQLGLTLAEAGQSAPALAILRPLAESGDPRDLNALTLALSEAGLQDEAGQTARRVLALDPDNPVAHEQLGLVHLRAGRWTEARDASRRALELNDRLHRAWNNLGVALYQLRQADGALDAWQRAVDLAPRLWDALYNLGTKAAEHDRPEQARRALAAFVDTAPGERYAADLRRARVLLGRLERALERQSSGAGP